MGVPDGAGKPCETHFRRTAYDPLTHTSLVTATPHTGRTHQIRAHLRQLGHPIANDPRYLHPPDVTAETSEPLLAATAVSATTGTTPTICTPVGSTTPVPLPPPLRLTDIVGGDAHAAAGAALGCTVCDAVSPPPARGWPGLGGGVWGSRDIWLWAAEYASEGGEWRFVAPLPAWAR
ncbi:hypothetical protein MMPV_003508 [Pyropia vietnamensis]